MPKDLKRTPLYSWHKEHGGQMIEFAGWEMPVAYERGILEENLSTRKYGIRRSLRYFSHGTIFDSRNGSHSFYATCFNEQCDGP